MNRFTYQQYRQLYTRHLRRGYQSSESLLKHFERPPRPARLRVSGPFKRSLYHKMHMRLFLKIVIERYGTLDRFDGGPVKSMYEISKRFKVPYTTVFRTLKQFVAGGYELKVCDHGQPRKLLDAQTEAQLLSKELLQEWCAFSLQERLMLIKQRFGVELTYYRLRNLYKRNGISYRSAQTVYRSALTNRVALQRQRLQFANLLANFLVQGHDLIYVDETSQVATQPDLQLELKFILLRVHAWMTKLKSWSYLDCLNEHHRNNVQHRFTIYAAIGPCLNGNKVFFLGRSTNQDEFQSFIYRVKAAVRTNHRSRKPLLLLGKSFFGDIDHSQNHNIVSESFLSLFLDNASAHTAKSSKKVLEELFTPLWNVPHTSQLNSIESLWSVIKTKLRKLMQGHLQELSKDGFKTLVIQACQSVSDEQVVNIMQANRASLLKFLSQDHQD